MPNHPSHYQDHTFLFLPELTDPQTAETIPPAASKSSTPLETLFHTIMSDGAKVFDPMAHLCAAVALPALASDGLLVINTRLPRNPHLLAQQMPRYLWRTAEADLYFAQDDAGRWRELFAAISSAGALTNDAEPINPRTPLAAAWRQTATRMGATPGCWRIAHQQDVLTVMRQRSRQLRRQHGENPAAIDAAVRDLAGWNTEQCDRMLRLAGQRTGRRYCETHRWPHHAETECWACARANITTPP